MPQTIETGDRTLGNGMVVLLARIVDRFGRCIQADDVAAIEYSIHEVDPHRPGNGTLDGGHKAAVALDVGDVVFNALQNDSRWSVDGAGYNFRHEVALREDVVSPEADARIEVRYVLTPTTGEKTIVRFQLKVA